jgi:hypothetical protein
MPWRFRAKHALGLGPWVCSGSREENASKQKIGASVLIRSEPNGSKLATLPGSLRSSLFAEQLAGRSIDEMKPAAGLADNGLISELRIVGRGLLRPPMHVHPGYRTFEDEVSHG